MSNCKTNPSGLQFFSIVTGEPGSSTETCEQSGTERSDLSGANAAAGAGEGASSFPCLYKTNVTESDKDEETVSRSSRSYYRKAAHALALNAEALVNRAGVDNTGFLTLTFPDNVECNKEARKRFRSFTSHYLKPHPLFGDWICVKERQKRGAWHYHLLIDCGCDIRTGIDWEAVSRRDYRSVPSSLRALWSELREVLPGYRFGRSELLPVKTNSKGVALYLAKYLGKHLGHRRPEDKGVRLVTYSRSWLRSGRNFQWNNENSKKWRAALAEVADFAGFESFKDFEDCFGPYWFLKYGDYFLYRYDRTSYVDENGRILRRYFAGIMDCRELFHRCVEDWLQSRSDNEFTESVKKFIEESDSSPCPF